MVSSHRPVGFADGHPALMTAWMLDPSMARAGALLPVYGWDLLKKSLEATFGRPGRQVAAGVNPAARATLEISAGDDL